MNKDFNVKSFVKEYEKQMADTDKARFLKTKLKYEKYMPYDEKLIIAENIIQSSCYAIVKEGDTLKKTDRIAINSPMRYILFVMTIVNKYTNIDVNFNSITSEFDYLNQNGLIEVIFAKIGDKEIGEFNTIVEMVLNDFMTNKYEFKNYVSDTLSRFSGLVNKCAPLIENITNKLNEMSEEDVEKLIGLFSKVTKLIK